jgi:uncharacterized delta-60 repeat protein
VAGAILSFSVAALVALAACAFDSDVAASASNDAGDAGDENVVTGQATSLSISVPNASVIDGETADVVVKIDRQGPIAGDTRVELVGLPPELTSIAINVPPSAKEAKLQVAAAPKTKHGLRKGISVHAVVVGREATAPLDVLVRGRPGALDTSFGEGGVVEVSLEPPAKDATAAGLGIVNDGGILVGALVDIDTGFRGLVARLNEDGTSASNYGTNGRTALLALEANGIAVFDDGRAIVCGRVLPSAAPALVGLTKSGGSDSSFAGGVVASYLPPNGASGSFNDCVASGGGSVTAVGAADTTTGPVSIVVRALSDGKPDPSWQSSGYQSLKLLTGEDYSQLLRSVVRADGRVLSTGSSIQNALTTFVALSSPASGTDANFGGSGGRATLPDSTSIPVLAIASDNSVLVGIGTATGAAVHKLTASGGTDPSFGKNGRGLFETIELVAPAAVALDATGRAVVAGRKSTAGTDFAMAVGRLSTSGAPDTTFGPNGVVVQTPVLKGTARPFRLSALAIQKDGRIVVAGTLFGATYSRPGVARVWP